MLLGPGDELEISFLGAPDLDTVQRIRRDGKISMRILGEVHAANRTSVEFKEELATLFAPHLQIKEVTVVVRSNAGVFVSGAVLAPGKIEMSRPLTALEAVMEAGGFNMADADMSHVVVLRQVGGQRKEYVLNLAASLVGKGGKSFYLKPHDIVHVPSKKHWL